MIKIDDPLIISALVFFILCILFLVAFIRSFRNRKFLSSVRNFTFAFLMLTLSLLFGVISISIQGYSALTREEEAATVEIIPHDDQSFTAEITFPNGITNQYKLTGEEFYIDAHILKWQYPVNLLGIHTFYEFDRVAGRYRDIEDDTTKKRTVYSLAQERLIDIFKLRIKYPVFSFLVDAEYGSASFVAADRPRKIHILVSTTGLLIRDAKE